MSETFDFTRETSPGGSGGDKNYVHTQGIADDTWTISHNMQKYPSVTVVDTGNNEVVGCVTHIDENNLTITFGFAFTGKAYLN